jgi:hypothetical protein
MGFPCAMTCAFLMILQIPMDVTVPRNSFRPFVNAVNELFGEECTNERADVLHIGFTELLKAFQSYDINDVSVHFETDPPSVKVIVSENAPKLTDIWIPRDFRDLYEEKKPAVWKAFRNGKSIVMCKTKGQPEGRVSDSDADAYHWEDMQAGNISEFFVLQRPRGDHLDDTEDTM